MLSLALVLIAAPPSVYDVDLAVDGSVIVVSAAAIAVPYAFGDSFITRRCPCDSNEVNAIDRIAIGSHNEIANIVSDVSVAAALTAPVALDVFDVGLSEPLLEDLTVYTEALTLDGALVTVAKYVTQRPLPLVYAGLAPDLVHKAGGYRSFYSGHVATTMTALMVMSTTYSLRHPDAVWPWIATGVFTASVAVERVIAGRHFPSDVAVGALSGLVFGYVVPRIHESTGMALALVPIDTPGTSHGGSGALVTMSLRL